MPTRDAFIAKTKEFPAFKGLTDMIIGAYADRALEALSSYTALKCLLRGVPADSGDGVYTVPEDARAVTGVYVSGTNVSITYEVKEVADGNTELWLYAIRVPSAINVISPFEGRSFSDGVFLNTSNRPVYGGSFRGYSEFDLEYSKNFAFSDLGDKHMLGLRYYCEYLAYEEKSAKASNLIDITDREPSGAQTTIRRSQAGNAYMKLRDDVFMKFEREVKRPYFSRDSFGILERLWMQNFDQGGYS